MAKIQIMFSRFSAFYSPLVATEAAGFLREEGLEAEFSVAGAGPAPRERLRAGEVHLIQSAVSSSFALLEQNDVLDIVHFAQVNQRDGFFLAGRAPDADFAWDRLRGARVLADHGGQPRAMLTYALHKQGIDPGDLELVDAGTPDAMIAAFRAGEGDYVHLQGPAPQQLERDGAGHIVASVGEAIGPVAFSSLCATRAWLETDMAAAFVRAYARARPWVDQTPAQEVARREAPFFPGVDQEALAAAILAYQRLGTWRPPLEITREAFEVTLDVFAHSGLISERHAYESVVVPPPRA